ncbi:MAG: 5'-methylthioadenosine/adenosylhomocysteine nucleosidase [Oscillospiraceae bacterium]|jgi:adenosylhomocysteine nucleosidase|nr:5'-methylthioadenosine/adenosylhomocysteine nucleosidase [Oscillospiraceae bacterium]
MAEKKVVGIIGAMPSELADIREILGSGTTEIQEYSGFKFYINCVNEVKTVNVCCGIAKVNAAVCTQVLIDRFSPEYIINAGIAGGMNNDVHVTDIVIADSVCPHDLDLKFLRNYPPYHDVFETDKELVQKAVKVCNELDVKSHIGRIVSGEIFLEDANLKKEICEKFNPHAVDMESAAVGHCCFLNKMPFVAIRCISDNADNSAAMSFDQFEKIAAKQVATIVLSFF